MLSDYQVLVQVEKERDTLKAEVEQLRPWASVGQSGMCVHSRFHDGCAGCKIRVLEVEVKHLRGVIEDTTEVLESFGFPLFARAIRDDSDTEKEA